MSDSRLTNFFKPNKKPLPKTVRNYETPEDSNLIEKAKRFPVFVTLAVVLVAVVIISVIVLNSKNNAFSMFEKASSKAFDCGSFDYKVVAVLNNVTQMEYGGTMELDSDMKRFVSSYHAKYADYEYDSVTYFKDGISYQGNYYDGKWTISNNTDKVLDFIDFYSDYRKGKFDAGAAIRFTDSTRKLSATQLEGAVDNIMKDLSSVSGLKNVLRCESNTNDKGTIVTFHPDAEKLFDIIKTHSGPAFVSANAYKEFCDKVDNAKRNFAATKVGVAYNVDKDGYLTRIILDYKIKADQYMIEVTLDNFENAETNIPDGFFVAAGIK